MFLNEDPRRKHIGRIVWPDRDSRLQNDGAGVKFVRHQVHGRAADLHPMLNGLRLCINARERRQQGRMDVEDRVRKRIEQSLTHQSHETGKAHQLHAS